MQTQPNKQQKREYMRTIANVSQVLTDEIKKNVPVQPDHRACCLEERPLRQEIARAEPDDKITNF